MVSRKNVNSIVFTLYLLGIYYFTDIIFFMKSDPTLPQRFLIFVLALIYLLLLEFKIKPIIHSNQNN